MQGCQPGNQGKFGKRVTFSSPRKSREFEKILQISDKLLNLIGPREKVASLL